MKNFKDFPVPADEFNNLVNELKNSEICQLEGQVTNKEIFLNLKEKLVNLLDKESEEMKIYNSVSTQNSNDYDIFISYCKKDLKEEIKLFRERLEKEKLKVAK